MYDTTSELECPTDELLISAIKGETDLSAEVTVHVDTCAVCQSRLETLSDVRAMRDYRDVAASSRFRQSVLGRPPRDNELTSLGHFQLEERIGRGGMGVVYRARDTKLGRTVAVKLLTNYFNPTALARFNRETRALSELNHPGIVPVYSAHQSEDGRPYLVMPLITGQSLKEALADEPIPVRRAAALVRQVAEGLQAAHESGLVHRDVKPANILLDEADGSARLIDFGLARGTDDATLTATAILCGTPEYMSPEQASQFEKADARSDVYSLGITLYECLTGSVPFRGKPLDILSQHRDLEPVPPSRMNKSVPRDLETICLKAVQKEPGSRYLTAADFANDLQRFLDGKTIQARPANVLEKTWRWAKRNPRVALLLIALVTTLVGGILMTTWQWQSSRANYVEAQANYFTAQQNFDAATELILNHRQFALQLSREVGHEKAARDLYRQILQEVNQLVVFRIDDPEIRFLQPRIYLSNAEIELLVGNAVDSIELFNESERLLRKLIEEENEGLTRSGSSVESDQQLSSIWHFRHYLSAVALLRGEAYHLTGDTARALEDYQTAKEILLNQLEDISNPNREKEIRNLALVLVLEGQVWSELADDVKALQCYQSAFQSLPAKMGLKIAAVEYRESSIPDLPQLLQDDSTRVTTVEKHINAFVAHFLGRHLIATANRSDIPAGQMEEGIRLLTWALEIRRDISTEEPLNAKNPAYSDWKRDVGMTLTELTKAAQQTGQTDLATEHINESVEILSPMAAASDRLELRLRLAQALFVRSKLSDDQDPNKQESNDLLRAQELCQSVLDVSPSWQECRRVLTTIEDELESMNSP